MSRGVEAAYAPADHQPHEAPTMTALTHPVTRGVAKAGWNRRDVQVGLLFAWIAVTAVASLAVSLLFPTAGDGGFFSYATVEPVRTFFWAFLTLAAANLVVTVVPVALAVVLLVPRRGWRWATAGFATTLIGAAFYAVGVGGWATVYFFAADSKALDPATASAFVASVNVDVFRIFGPAAGGAILIAIGTLVLSIGLWRSGNVPRWVILLGVFGSVITFILPTAGVVGVLVESPQAFTSVVIGWYAWRRRDGGTHDALVS